METIDWNAIVSDGEPGVYVTTHPMPPGDRPAKFFRDILESYEENGKEVIDFGAYNNPIYDDASNVLYRKQIDSTYGLEVRWRWK